MSYIGKAPIDRTLGLSQKNVFTGDGSTTSFDMSSVAVGDTAVDVFIDNVRQEPGTGKAYILASNGTDFRRITFNTAPVSGAVIWTNNRLRTQVTNTLPSDGSVTDAMLNDNVVTGQSALGTTPAAADALLIYDDSASALKKVTYANFGGDISSVVAGTGLSGGGTSGAVTLNVEAAQTHEDNFAAYSEKYAPKVKGIIEAGIQTSQKSYLEALKFQKQYSEKLSEQLIDCEIILTPTALSGAPTPETTGQPVFQAPWTTAGVPAISIPYTLDEDGMPLGAQLISNRFN